MLWQLACRRKTSRAGAFVAPWRRSIRGTRSRPGDACRPGKTSIATMTTERRWNGWGDASVQEALKPEALAFLAQAVGEARPLPDATLAAALAQVEAQPSRLPPHPLVDI